MHVRRPRIVIEEQKRSLVKIYLYENICVMYTAQQPHWTTNCTAMCITIFTAVYTRTGQWLKN